MKFNKKTILGFIFLFFILLILSKYNKENKFIHKKIYAMGGIPINIYLYGVDKKKANEFTRNYKELVNSLEDRLSKYRKESLVSKFNNFKALKPFSLDKDFYNCIDISFKVNKLSFLAFDITVQPLIKLWKKAGKLDKLPTKNEINSVLKDIGMNYLIFDKEKQTLEKKKSDISIDLGGVAKGYFADKGIKLAEDMGIKKIIIELGGDMYCLNKLDSKDFVVGIVNPLDTKKLAGKIYVKNEAVVTSGNYERYVIIKGKKYCHIINPITGYPVDNGVLSVTVVADNGGYADALATAFYVLGVEKTKKVLNKLKDIGVVFIYKDKNGKLRYFVSDYIKSKVKMFINENK